MQASSRNSISTIHQVETFVPLNDAKLNSGRGFQPEEYELAGAAPHHVGSFLEKFASNHPVWYSRAIRFMAYWRGPRPKVELPEPSPLLDVEFKLRRQLVILPLESSLIGLTRPLASPRLLLALGAAYIIGFAFFSRAQSFLTPASSWIGCTSVYWSANDGCGLNGEFCEPFTNLTFDFRCPAQCDIVTLENPRTVGAQQVVYEPLIVGGGDLNRTYRGDSFICAAANQAGLISNAKGGCGSLELIGNFTDFLPTTENGLDSIGFPTVFPLSFRFLQSTTPPTHCDDLRDEALVFNILITWILFVILRPKPIVLYWCIVCIGYWHVVLFSQPKGPPPPLDIAFGAFLPALFVAYAFWRLAFRFTLPAFRKAPLEAAVWYLAPFWAGVLTNLTTNNIPINSLTASALKRPGAIPALVIIIVIVTIMVINQIRVIRKTGWLPYYAGWYILGGLVTLVISQLPGLELRLHHYILSMVLMPGTAFPTRLSAIYQGFLLGMFLNGVAAFGFDSILQTAADLLQDAPMGTLLPTFLTNSSTYNASIPFSNQTITWDALPDGWDGFALLVDDVERYVGTALNFSLAALDPSLPHFFRLALTSGATAGDFTMAAVLWPNGTWIDPPPGPS